jgi:enoyl-CoA hydratase
VSITIEDVDDAVVVTLRWPEARNAMGPVEAQELADAIEEASVRRASALILTGEGAFCSGGDLKSFADLSAAYAPVGVRRRVYGHVQRIFRGLRAAGIPTIAAVDGPAIGLGMDLALACDMRFVGPQGWMQQGWARLGIIPAGAGAWFLERTAPGLLWEMVDDQRRLGPEDCQEWRLGQAVTPTALEAALARATSLSRMSLDRRAAYAELSRQARWPSDDYLELCADYQAQFIGSIEFQQAAAQVLRPRDDR